MRRKSLLFLLLTALTVFAASACQMDKAQEQKKYTPPAETKLDTQVAEMISSMNLYAFNDTVPAPDFELESLKGNRVSLGQYRGKVVLLSYWATW